MFEWKRSVAVSALFAVMVAATAEAQASRTWVSGVGDDVNPCSRTAPCKTFAGAISKTANGGFINVLDGGGYGTLTITKSLTVEGEGSQAGMLASGVAGVIINGAGVKVVLRNLSIESPSVGTRGTYGIRVFQAAEVHVENVVINGFLNQGILFSPTGGGEGHISNTTLINNAGGGIEVTTGRVMVDGLRAQSNDNGVIVTGNAIAVVRNSFASGGTIGFGATTNSAAVLNIENCVSTHNTYGVFAGAGATARVSDTAVLSNVSIGLFNDGMSFLVSLGGNELVGNPTMGAFTSTVAKQ